MDHATSDRRAPLRWRCSLPCHKAASTPRARAPGWSWCSSSIRCGTTTSMTTAATGRRGCAAWSPRAPASATRRTRTSTPSRAPGTPRSPRERCPRSTGSSSTSGGTGTSRRSCRARTTPQRPTIRYGSGQPGGGHSAKRLRVPSFAQTLDRAQGGRAHVVTMSMKPRSAIMLAGGQRRRGDLVRGQELRDVGGVQPGTRAVRRAVHRVVAGRA